MTHRDDQRRPAEPPPLGLGLAASLLAVAAFAFVRLYLYPDRSVPLTYALPLLMGIWHKHRPLHWALTVALAAVAAVQTFWMWPEEVVALVSRPVSYAMMLANIGIVAAVVDRLIVMQRQLRASYGDLEQANQELGAVNEELVAREEEISSQNEELQMQAQEMEHQLEELHEQSEELQQQSVELQLINEEAASRQRVLQALLETSTTPVSEGGLAAAAHRICAAALEATAGAAQGAMVLTGSTDETVVLGRAGIELSAPQDDALAPWRCALARTAIAERRTAAVEDLAHTPEVLPPADTAGHGFHAALASPILNGEGAVGALVLYSRQARMWSAAEFQIAEWLAAQASLVLLSARLQQEIDRRRSEAEEASQRKTRFLAAVSHDVRTPANAISLTAEVIKQAGDDPKWAHEIPELARALQSNAKLLVELVSDVLDLSRFDSGKVDVEPSEFNLQEMVGREIMQYQAMADGAGLELRGTTDAAPVWLRTDRMKLARVLSNLLGNALKFTERGRIEVRCSRADDGAVEIHVDDTGVGIQDAQLEHIFDEFFQIKNPERDRSKGTGLGLAICKRLVDAIGCSLSVRSRYGAGTTFTIRIPQELCVAGPQADGVAKMPQLQQQPAGRRLAGLRVLLVEDHEDTRAAFSRLLTSRGATVKTAADGREALRMLGHYAPDVVLLDLMLPDMDGREVLRQLAGVRPANLRCLLAVSGDVTQGRLREVESLGADGLVAKPLHLDMVVERICTQLREGRGHENDDPTATSPQIAG